MKHLIFGTAGHVDHGKTALIRALTGMETDRLKEEKRRGLTIDLGFAHMEFPDGIAGIIDVPGHEKFLRNMLAGVGALDLALLVVAADEGVMPQTREHLEILELLGTPRGLIVMTKCDLVDAETLALAKEETKEAFARSFLENASVVPVSCKTGEGIPELRNLLFRLAQELPARNIKRAFRMAVDRAFTVEGFGAVATGTVLDGTLMEGEEVELCPCGQIARVRSLQSYGTPVKAVVAGQRAALNLAHVRRDVLARGIMLAQPGTQRTAILLGVKLSLLPGTVRTIKSGTRLHLYLGATSVLCRVSLAQTDLLRAGETAYAQLRLEAPVCALCKDRFVVRFYSPLETVGGGVVLDACMQSRKRLDSAGVERLKYYDVGSLSDQILCETSRAVLNRSLLTVQFPHVELEQLLDTVAKLLASGKIIEAGGLLFTTGSLKTMQKLAIEQLGAYHEAHPLEWGMPMAQLEQRLPAGVGAALREIGMLQGSELWAALPGFSPLQTEQYTVAADRIQTLYASWNCMPHDISELPALLGIEEQIVLRVLALLVEQGQLERLTQRILISHEAFVRAKQAVEILVLNEGAVTLAQLRDELRLSRKYAAALLEHMDNSGFTVRNGDQRTLANQK